MMHPAALLDQHLSSYLPENIHLKQDDPRTLESLLGLSAESVHPENVSNAATVDRLVDSLPQSLVEARGGVSGGLPPPPPPPPPQQVAISSASPQPAQTPILLTASHVLDGQQGLTFTVAPHGVHQHHLVSSGGAVASNAGHAAPAGTQFVAFQSPLGFAPAGFVAIGGGGPAGGGAGGSPAAPVAPSSPSPVQSPYHLQTHSPLPTHASSLPRSSPAPPPLTPSPSPSPSSTTLPSVAQAVGSASVSAPASAPTTLHHLRPNTPIQVQLPASAFPLLQILQQGGTSQGGVSGTSFRANAGPGTPQQHLHPQPPPPPPRPKQPQLLPKPASGAPTPVTNTSIAVSSSSTCIASPAVQSVVSTVASTAPAAVGPHGAQLVIGQNHPHHHHSPAGTLVLNQMIPGLSQSPVIIQQPGGGVQFILRQQQQQQSLVGGAAAASAPAGGVLTAPGVVGGAKGVGGGLVLAGAQGQVLIHHPQHQQLQQQSQGRPLGGTAGPGMAVQAGAATGGQVVRFIATTQGPMQLQQIQTPSGPTLIAVPPGQTLAFPQLRGATAGSGSVVPGAVIQSHAQIIQGATVAPTAQTIQTHLMQQQQQQSLVHGGLANQGRTSGPTATMLPNHSAVNVVDSVGVVARTRTMGTGMSPMSVISPPPSLSFPPPQPRKKPKKKKKRKGSRDDEEDGEGSTEVEESGEEMCGGVPGKTLNLADIMKSAGIGDDEDLGPFESGVTDGGDDSSLVQAPQTVQTNAMQQQSNGGGVGSSPDICTNTCVPSQADGLGPHPGLNSNHHQHSSPQQSHLLAQLQGSLAVQQAQGHVRFALSEDGRVLFQRDCATAGQSMSSQTPPSVVSSVTPPIQSQSQTILLHQQSVAAPRAHIAPPAPQPVSQLLSTSANTPSGNVMGGGVGGGSTSGGSPSTGSPAPNNHVVLSQLLSHGGSVNNTIGETALPTLPVGTQLGVGTLSNQNLRSQQQTHQQPIPQMPHPENQVNSSMQLPPSPQYQKPITPNMHQQQQSVQVHQPSPQPPPPKHSPPPPEQPQTSHQNQPNSPPSPSFQENQNNSNTVNIGGLVLTQQQQALLHQIKMSDLVAAGAASGLGAKSLTEALIQALSAVASNINLGNSPSSPEQKGGSKCSRPGGKSSQGPPTSTQLLLQQLGAAVAAAARKVIPAGAVVEPGMAQDVRRPSPPVARKRRKKATDVSSPTAISGPRLQGGGHVQNDISRAGGRLSHTPNSPRATTPGTGVTQPVNSFSSPVPSSITESKLSSPIVPAPAIPDSLSQNSNSCEPGLSQESRLNQMNTQVPMCQQSPPQLVPISSSASSSPSTTTSSATTTSSLTSDSSKVHPVSSSSGMVMSGQSPVIPRVQTIQLTAQKQQQLREVQSQLQALTNRKGPRTAQENLAIQHLYLQQQRILLTGKIVPTIPGQHAQGVQFSPLSPSSPSPDQLMAGNSSVGVKGGKAPSTCLANLLRQPVSSTQSPTIRYYHQVGNQIIPLAPQQAVTSAQGGGSRSMETRPSKTNVGPIGRTPSPPSPTTTVQSPSITSPVINDSVPVSTTGPSSPVNTVVSAQRELYVCVGGNSGAEDEGDSSSVESALNKQMQGGSSLSSEEQPNGSSCAKSPSKTPVPSSMSQASVCLSTTTQTPNSDSSAVMQSSPATTSVTSQNLSSQGTDAPGEDAASQTTDSSLDASSPRNGIKRPALSPVRPTINKVSLIEQQLRTDQAGALNPDVHTPFSGKADACKRLVRYHVLNERVLSARDLDKADEIFEATARHLLDKFSQMTAKYRYLLLMESMKEVRTSELMMIDRMFVAEEQLALERLKEEARLAEEMEKKKNEEESKSEENANGSEETNPNPSASSTPASSETGLKEVRINLHDVLKSEAIKKEPEEGRYTIVRNPTPVVKEEEVRPEEEKPYDEWEAIQKELSVYCGVKREERNREEHPPNGEPGARQLPAGEESSCDASRSPGLGGPAPPLDDPGGGNMGENSNLCEDDDINAQVQSAIDSILNLQRAEDEGLGLEDVFDVTLEEEEEEEERRTVDTGGNRGGISRASCEVEDSDALSKEEVGGGDLALDEAVRSILSS